MHVCLCMCVCMCVCEYVIATPSCKCVYVCVCVCVCINSYFYTTHMHVFVPAEYLTCMLEVVGGCAYMHKSVFFTQHACVHAHTCIKRVLSLRIWRTSCSVSVCVCVCLCVCLCVSYTTWENAWLHTYTHTLIHMPSLKKHVTGMLVTGVTRSTKTCISPSFER